MRSKAEETAPEEILNEVLEGLNAPRKYLPSKLFYDEKGSELFDKITELIEYYPTRTEIKIM
ncbi:MAG TPA: L-histidine N(alpha)-methyltransferase, partial [Ignavibacteriaceae bacterium]|nr:L-histidine N(alpha)-methyltransferase [Ignavibacteriaceae bacterium]